METPVARLTVSLSIQNILMTPSIKTRHAELEVGARQEERGTLKYGGG